MSNLTYAVDTETTGLDSFAGAKPFAIITCDELDQTAYIENNEPNYDPHSIGRLLGSEDIVKVFHNAKFDILMLDAINLQTRGTVHDTMFMAYCYNPLENNYRLKDLAAKYLGIPNDEQEEVKKYMRKHRLKSYADVPKSIMEPYARQDTVITMGLYKFYRDKGILEDPIYKREMKLLQAIVQMQRRGVKIDVDFCKRAMDPINVRKDEILAIIKRDHNDINVNSNDQLADYLFVHEGLVVDALTPSGKPCFDKTHIKAYDHPIVPLIIELRDLSKVVRTYLEPLYNRAKDNVGEENIIHCDFNQIGARTGRLSCSKPNLQNITYSSTVNVREAFICREGFSNYYVDYSQIELRILAHYSKEPSMILELCKAGGDLHALTCQGVFGEVTKELRNVAKRINFGIIYGMGPKKFCEMIQMDFPELGMTYSKAKQYINNYYKTYPMVRKFTWRVPQKVLEVGYVSDIFGRKYKCATGESYKAVNYLIQGCAAGIIKQSMIEVHDLLQDVESNMLLTIHDELVIEVKHGEEHLLKDVVEIMEYRDDTFRVPITVNIENTDTNWTEKSEILL